MNENGKLVSKLGDFGILVDRMGLPSTKALTKTNVGTPRYMSWERLDRKEYGRSSDVWAIGLVLYEMLSGGKTGFDYENSENIFDDIKYSRLTPLPDYVNKKTFAFVKHLVHMNPDDRPTVE